MYSLLINIHNHKADEALKVLAIMRNDLEKYAKTENASTKAIEVRNNILSTLIEYATSSEQLIQSLIEENNKEFKRGFRKGYEAIKREEQPSPYDKEGKRLLSIVNARNSQPHLY